MWITLYFKHKNFQKVVDYPPFERVVEIVDHPPFVEIFDLHIHFTMSISRKKKNRPWKRFSLPLGICNKEISLFMNPLHTYKETKHH